MTDTQPSSDSKRLFMNISAFAMMFMMTCIIFASAAGLFVTGWAMYGWLLRGEVKYAEHWSAEERSALNAFDSALKFDNDTLTNLGEMYQHWEKAGVKEPAEDTFAWAMRHDICTLPYAKKWNTQLREFVSTPADVVESRLKEEKEYSLPHVAAAMGHWEAMKVFVARGFPVNQATNEGHTLLSVVLSNMSSLPQDEIFAVAEWLVSQGAEVKPYGALYEAIYDADYEHLTLEWLLAHGMPLEMCRRGERTWLPIEVCVEHNVAMGIFQQLAQDGKIDVNDRRANMTYLQVAALYGESGVVEMLLALGAQTELLPEDGANETPFALALRSLASRENEADGGNDDLLKIRALLEYNAQPQPLPHQWSCPQLKSQTQEMLLKYGHTPQEQQPENTPES